MVEIRQTWDADRYARNARFVAEYAAEIVSWLDARAGERILDLGCGDGALTETLAASGARVVAVDASPEMVAAARARGLDARQMDARALDFVRAFDAVFTNAMLHWVPEADVVIAGVARALVPGGRFVGELGGEGNIAAIVEAASAALARRGIEPAGGGPWYFPSADDYRARLEAAGFAVARIGLHARPTPLPGPLSDWLDTFGESFLALVPEGEREALKDEVGEALRPRLCGTDGTWHLDYVRLRFAATLPREG
jgi:trans-aconitate methyltransferase